MIDKNTTAIDKFAKLWCSKTVEEVRKQLDNLTEEEKEALIVTCLRAMDRINE